MPPLDPAEAAWLTRLVELSKDLERMSWLARRMGGAGQGSLSGDALWVEFGKWLDERVDALNDLLEQVGSLDVKQKWQAFADQVSACQQGILVELELLGGMAIAPTAEGTPAAGLAPEFLNLAQGWLNQIITECALGGPVRLVIGRSAAIEPDPGLTSLVRVPFLDWDLWHLPLLGRQLGLLAAVRDPGGRLAPLFGSLEGEVSGLFESGDPAIALEMATHYLRFLFADCWATALIGPVYALAVFALELDFSAPLAFGAYQADDPQERLSGGRFLPSTAQRAATILETLRLTQELQPRQSWEDGAYEAILKELEELWKESLGEGAGKLLEDARQVCLSWVREVFQEGVRKILPAERLVAPLQTWVDAEMDYQAKKSLSMKPLSLVELLSLTWLHRQDSPDGLKCHTILKEAEDAALKANPYMVNFPRQRAANRVLRVRVQRLSQRMERLAALLEAEGSPIAAHPLVSGRFYQGLSYLDFYLERARQDLQEGKVTPQTWKDIQATEGLIVNLQREASEYIGGVLLRQQGLDCEPKEVGLAGEDGPSLCALADRLFREYAERSGVNWSAVTVPGISSFVARKTEIIRTEFPDWSLWNLPVMAHEFGHLVAFATPEFQAFQAKQRSVLGENNPRVRHLDEFFADLFAVYTLGPAFAACVILLQFNPVQAHLTSDTHPTQAERVEVILAALRRMNQKPPDARVYDEVIASLAQGWQNAIQQCGLEGQALQTKLLEHWGGEIFAILERNYRVGVGYRQEQWELAEKLAVESLAGPKLPPYPSLEKLNQAIQPVVPSGKPASLGMGDLLNLLWISRMNLLTGAPNLVGLWQNYRTNLEKLSASAVLLGHDYLAR